MKGLTQRQQQVLDFIRSEIDTVGRPPTQHEIKDHFGWASTNAVRTHLRLLEDKGELTYDKHQARGIRLKSEPRGREVRDLPLVGQVPAGTPTEAIENAEDAVGVDPEQFPDDNLFALKVKGDSMQGAGIFEGDTVIVRQQADARTGQIVVTLIDGEATVKRFVRKGRKVLLHPENDAYEDIVIRPDQDASICGVVAGVVRKL
jgi:repressor LexA